MKTVLLIKLILFLILLSFGNTWGQTPHIDINMIERMAKRELHNYRKMIQNETKITLNQEMYDVKYYSLDLKPDPTTKILTGSVEILFEVLSPSLDSIELNFWDGMIVSDIYLSETPDSPLNFSHNNDLLSLNLDSTFPQGEEISVTVNYSGSPQNSGNP